jgi:hypothetical protein
MKYSLMKRVAIVVFTAALAAPAGAADRAPGYPESFQRTGVIDQVPTAANPTLIINDYAYAVSPSVVVRTPTSSRSIPVQTLRVKQYVGFTVSGEGPESRGQVTEIWVLPQKPVTKE